MAKPKTKRKIKPITDAEVARMYELYQSGMSRTNIGKALGRSMTTVSNRLKEHYGIEAGESETGDWPSESELKQLNEQAAIEAWNQPLTLHKGLDCTVERRAMSGFGL